MTAEKLNEIPLQQALAELQGWQLKEGKLWLEVQLKDFRQAVALTGKIAEAAESMDHHPDIHLENYNQLRISLVTHSAGGITQKDIELAERISALYKGSLSD